ncbi:YlbF family regulator [Paenibacillus sedimenti]|uniref:YlbF family regulator n=1 Tax=Paenibacillus sedimenti TaxID=2770274 RepID=A0A926KM56_9BACL|nr:YlbF family regulator [Paenibacillus sedimenti]MBD0379326.1 YlbF family regulator [Paenibacillus sedimenti]
MNTMEMDTLDMSAVLMQAYDMGDMINSSAEVADYLYWKSVVEKSEEVRVLKAVFARKKELFEECERFGHYHPSYHEALAAVNEAQQKLDALEAVRRFKEAEDRLDDLLFTVSSTIAHAVSESIKVPSNNPLPTGKGCSSGGSCSGNCG